MSRVPQNNVQVFPQNPNMPQQNAPVGYVRPNMPVAFIQPQQIILNTNSKPNVPTNYSPVPATQVHKFPQSNVLEEVHVDDESIIDLELEKNLTKIDYEKMKLTQKQRHAVKLGGKFYTCGDVCCNFQAGSHVICKSSEKSDLTKFGVGIMLYFKFLKQLILFFTIFVILSLPALVLYTASFASFNKSKTSFSYVDLLTSTTLGSIGLGSTSCGVASPADVMAGTATISFTCPTGTIVDVDNSVVYGLIDTGSTCSFIEDGDLDSSCNFDNTTSIEKTFTTGQCIGNSACNITVPSNIFETTAACNQTYTKKNIYMKVTCTDDYITVFSKYSIAKSTVAYIVAIADTVIIALLLFMIYTLKFAQKSAAENVLKKAYSASSYTLEIRNLPQTMPSEELAAKLWTFVDNKLGAKSLAAGHRVVDVQIVLPNKLIDDFKKVGEVIRKKNFAIRQFMQTYVPEYPKSEITFPQLTTIMESLKTKQIPTINKADKLYKKIKTLYAKKEKLLAEIHRLKTTKNIRIVSAFITFSSIPARDKIRSVFASSPIDRCMRVLCGCCYNKDISFYGKILRARSASDPGSILWENLGEPGPKVFLRRTVSGLFTIALWVVSAGILILSTYYKNEFKKSYPTLDCSKFNPTMEEAYVDYELGDLQTGLLGCFCSKDVFGTINTKFPDGKLLCSSWFEDKVIETSVTFAIVFVVLIINFVVQFIFQALSEFEKHSTLNKQLAMRVVKTFVAQFLNTGVLILLVNYKLDISFWQGEFKDITPLWYENVGSTLLSTMVINIISVPSIKLAGILFQRIQRCCDRGCSFDERKTRKGTQVAYENLYTGPEFIVDFRYSQILTLIFVCFLYSGGMPLLYITSLAQLILTYYFDKLFLLRFSKLPKNYDENLESVVRVTLYFILIAHLVFAIFMFGNPLIFDQTESTFSSVTSAVTSISSKIQSGSESLLSKFINRMLLQHNIILFFALVLIVGAFLVKGVLLDLLKKTVFAVFSKETDEIKKPGSSNKKVAPHTLPNYTFFHVIKSDDIANLIRLTKVTIKSTENEELKNHQKKKLALLKQEYLIKKQEEQTGRVDPNLNFIGFYTYDVRLHPSYKSQFAIEEMLDDENLN